VDRFLTEGPRYVAVIRRVAEWAKRTPVCAPRALTRERSSHRREPHSSDVSSRSPILGSPAIPDFLSSAARATRRATSATP